MIDQLVRSVRASSVAELVWSRPDGTLGAAGVTALLLDERPAVAFTYAQADAAREIGAAPLAALAMTERRSTGGGFAPLVAVGRPGLTEDPHGRRFVDDLLPEELRRYPPARRYADSPLLRREHWWYLPRLLLTLDVADVRELPGRDTSAAHLLATTAPGHDLSVGVAVLSGPALEPTSDQLALSPEPAVRPGTAVLLGQDASFPDLEQWSQWRWRGHWDGSHLTPTSRPDRTGLEPIPGLLQRWRSQRDLERRCRWAIPQ